MNTDMTLLEALSHLYPGASNSTLRKKLAHGQIFVRGKICVNPKEPIADLKEISLQKPRHLLGGRVPIVFQDEHVIVLDKPEGLLSVDTDKDTNSLHMLIKKNVENPIVYPVHRLDRETSGLIVFALTTLARDALKEELVKREVHRIYHAVVSGTLPRYKDTIELNLVELENRSMKVVEQGGETAITHYKVLAKRERTSLIECKLDTGKKHQIRVSMAYLGAPIVGDPRYGEGKKGSRLLLHATTLSFTHPVTKKRLRFTSKTPFA